MESWRYLKDICLLIADCPHSTPIWTTEGVVVLRNQNIRNGRLDLSEPSYTDQEHYLGRVKRAKPQFGDLVLTREAPMGEICMIPPDLQCCLGQRQVLLRPNPTLLDSQYLLYAFQEEAIRKQIFWNEGTGTTVSNVRIPLIESLKIPYLPLPEQRAIASILGSLDEKIELNRRQNATLEAMAQRVFRAWFVDFEPVRAKQAGIAPACLDPETAALFPDGWEDETETLPKGWRFEVIKNLTDFALGGDWGKDNATDGDLQPTFCIRGADIPFLQEGGTGKMPTRYLKTSSLEKRSLRDGDLVIEISGGSPTQSTGRPVYVSKGLLSQLEYPLVTSNFCRMVRFNNPKHARFVYLWMCGLYSQGSLMQYEMGTTGIKNFGFSRFSQQTQFALPPEPIAQFLDDLVAPMFEQIQANGAQSRTLAAIRDQLLPRLLSGALRVPKSLIPDDADAVPMLGNGNLEIRF